MMTITAVASLVKAFITIVDVILGDFRKSAEHTTQRRTRRSAKKWGRFRPRRVP